MSDIGWYGRTWYDRKQNDRIESLNSQLAGQRSQAQRLTAQISKVQGNLEQRLNRLASAFDAFVELSDLREELRSYQPAVAARHRARQVLGRIDAAGAKAANGSSSPGPGPDSGPGSGVDGGLGALADLAPPVDPYNEVPGYWLPSALAGLVATVTGDGATAETALIDARALDPVRTDLFLCLALLLGRRTERAAEMLPGLLDLRTDQPVTLAQRELWLGAAAGRFGGSGRAVIVGRLTALVGGLTPEARIAEASPWRSLLDGIEADPPVLKALPRRITAPPALLVPIRGARQLDALAEWYRKVAGPQDGDSTSAPDPAATPASTPASTTAAAPDPLQVLLRELVDEGAPDEQPLLLRAAELRKVIQADTGGQAPPAPSRWKKTVDKPLALLLADVGSAEPRRRTVAARAGAPLIAALADGLASAATQPPPDRTEVTIGGYPIGFGTLGVDKASVAKAQTAVLHPGSASASSLASDKAGAERYTKVGGGLVAVGGFVVLWGLLLMQPGLWALLGPIVAGVGVWLLFEARKAKDSAEYTRQRRQSAWTDLERQITQVETALNDLRTLSRTAVEDAVAAREKLNAQLTGTGVPPVPPSPVGGADSAGGPTDAPASDATTGAA
jgi:hypothetical protein